MHERWKRFYHGAYEVSNLGKIRNYKSKKILRVGPNKNGYYRVRVSYKYIKASFMVHVLVARAFIGPSPFEGFAFEYKYDFAVPTKFDVNHKDLDKSNNKWDNLEWLTRLGNMQHAVINGVHFGPSKGMANMGEANGMSKLSDKDVDTIKYLWKTGKYSQIELSDKFNITKNYVCSIVNGKVKR
jgi:hypothetical protein